MVYIFALGAAVSLITALALWLLWRQDKRQVFARSAAWAQIASTVPLVGYLTAAASPNPVPTLFMLLVLVPHAIAPDQAVFDVIQPVHKWLAVGLIALAGWHAAKMSFGATGLASLRVARSKNADPPSKSG